MACIYAEIPIMHIYKHNSSSLEESSATSLSSSISHGCKKNPLEVLTSCQSHRMAYSNRNSHSHPVLSHPTSQYLQGPAALHDCNTASTYNIGLFTAPLPSKLCLCLYNAALQHPFTHPQQKPSSAKEDTARLAQNQESLNEKGKQKSGFLFLKTQLLSLNKIFFVCF